MKYLSHFVQKFWEVMKFILLLRMYTLQYGHGVFHHRTYHVKLRTSAALRYDAKRTITRSLLPLLYEPCADQRLCLLCATRAYRYILGHHFLTR